MSRFNAKCYFDNGNVAFISRMCHNRKKGFSLRGSTKANNRTNDFTHCTNETDLANHSMRITTCTHLNGHHSIRQSCPRARKFLDLDQKPYYHIISINHHYTFEHFFIVPFIVG